MFHTVPESNKQVNQHYPCFHFLAYSCLECCLLPVQQVLHSRVSVVFLLTNLITDLFLIIFYCKITKTFIARVLLTHATRPSQVFTCYARPQIKYCAQRRSVTQRQRYKLVIELRCCQYYNIFKKMKDTRCTV